MLIMNMVPVIGDLQADFLVAFMGSLLLLAAFYPGKGVWAKRLAVGCAFATLGFVSADAFLTLRNPRAHASAAEFQLREARRNADKARLDLVVLRWANGVGKIESYATEITDDHTGKAEVAFSDGRVATLGLQGEVTVSIGDGVESPFSRLASLPEGTMITGVSEPTPDGASTVIHMNKAVVPWAVSNVSIMKKK